jgi:hypothetical protein
MSTTVAPVAPGRRSRRWWYVLAIGLIVLVLAIGTLLTLRLHPFGIGGNSTTAPRQHATERTAGAERATGSEKTSTNHSGATDTSTSDKSGAAGTSATGPRPREKAIPTPGA